MRVAQADDAVELRPHARLLGNLARHGRRKVLPWLGEAAPSRAPILGDTVSHTIHSPNNDPMVT